MSVEDESVFERYAIVTRTDIADAMRKLEAHEREHVAEKSHVSWSQWGRGRKGCKAPKHQLGLIPS